MDSISEKVIKIISEYFDDGELSVTENLCPEEYPNWDSLAHVELLEIIMREFEIEISMMQMLEIKNVKDMIDIIREMKCR